MATTSNLAWHSPVSSLEKIQGHLGELVLLGGVTASWEDRTPERSGLDFDEDKGVLLLCDDVHLASFAGVVRLDDPVSLFLQKPEGELFTCLPRSRLSITSIPNDTFTTEAQRSQRKLSF